MCGISGVTKADTACVSNMIASIAHRGPDGRGVELVDTVTLGHARLAILDPTERSNQPMYSPSNNTVIVFNGEIYNFKELIQAHSLECVTSSDTEVLLLLYEKLGINMVQHLRGMFAFALYDRTSGSLYLVRDSSGIKPLYYSVHNGVLFFASEVKALLRGLSFTPTINQTALSLYMDHRYVPRPHTLYNDVYSMDSGEIIQWRNGTLTKSQFSPEYLNKASTVTDALRNSVAAHMISDKPVGLFLSGGLDSTICLHHMREVSTTVPTTFTIGFDVAADQQPAKFNADALIAKQTALHYGSHHHEVVLDAETCLQAYSDTAFFLDQPNANTTSVVQYVLSKYAKQHVDVVLTGIGGDELFSGYNHYRYAFIKHLARFLPAAMPDMIGKKMFKMTDSWFSYSEAEFMRRVRLTQWPSNSSTLWQGDWYDAKASITYITDRFARVTTTSFVRRTMEYDQYGWLIDEALRLTDASTMAAGIEARTPFIDPVVIAYAKQLPLGQLASVRHSKKYLRTAYKNLLPAAVVHAPKSGFFSPFAKWLRGDCKPLLDEALESEYLARYISLDALRDIAALHHTGEQYALSELTTMIQLHFWFKAQERSM